MGNTTNPTPGGVPAPTAGGSATMTAEVTVTPAVTTPVATPPEVKEWLDGKTVGEVGAIYLEAKATGKPEAEVAAGEEWKKRLV